MVNQDSSTIVVDYLWVRYQNTSILFVQFYYKTDDRPYMMILDLIRPFRKK